MNSTFNTPMPADGFFNPTEQEMINFIETYNWEIEAPESGESSTWVVYGPNDQLGGGLGCARTLRGALRMAMKNQIAKNTT